MKASIATIKKEQETQQEFDLKIAHAKATGMEFVETNAEMLAYLAGGPCDVMDYKGVKVYSQGKVAEVKARLSRTTEDINFGASKVTMGHNSGAALHVK